MKKKIIFFDYNIIYFNLFQKKKKIFFYQKNLSRKHNTLNKNVSYKFNNQNKNITNRYNELNKKFSDELNNNEKRNRVRRGRSLSFQEDSNLDKEKTVIRRRVKSQIQTENNELIRGSFINK